MRSSTWWHLLGSFPMAGWSGDAEPRLVTQFENFQTSECDNMGPNNLDLLDILGETPQADAPSIRAIVTETELAVFLGLAASQIRTKVRDGVFVKAGRARYDLRASVQNYVQRLRSIASVAGRPASVAVKESRRELTEQQTRLARLKADEVEGRLVERDAVLSEWVAITRDIRAAMLAVADRYGASNPHLTATDIAALDLEIRIALEGVANDG